MLARLALVCGFALQALACARGATQAPAARAEIEVFTRPGCPRCDEATRWLGELQARHPGTSIVVADVGSDPRARERLRVIAAQAGAAAVSVPAFWVNGSLVVGFAGETTTGARIEALLTGAAPPAADPAEQAAACGVDVEAACDGLATPTADEIDLPVLGRVRARELGLPLFTIAVGLVDGFNPCATWVLLFLLSFLAGLRSRTRMLVIAGVFVLVSALAYYAFMAAWVAVFSLIGFSRALQLGLGAVGLVVGAVNVKDFFAFHRGPTFSIPESAKPGIYRRMRAVVRADTLAVALLAAGVLAVLVNLLELLCTAGLPALYTQVLASQRVPAWKRYAYLGLYDAAYMLDDTILVGVAVVTLGRRQLQEKAGRWLKLLSGAVMLALAGLLLLRPQWLQL